MIGRIWRARAAAGRAPLYREHFMTDVLPALRGLSGYAGATILECDADDAVAITVITRWESMDAIRQFAGSDMTVAVVADAAKHVLLQWDDRVEHHEITYVE